MMWKSVLVLMVMVGAVRCLQEHSPLENTLEQTQQRADHELINEDPSIILKLKYELETSIASILEIHQSHNDKRFRLMNEQIGSISTDILADIEQKLTPLKNEVTSLKQQVSGLSAQVTTKVEELDSSLVNLRQEIVTSCKAESTCDEQDNWDNMELLVNSTKDAVEGLERVIQTSVRGGFEECVENTAEVSQTLGILLEGVRETDETVESIAKTLQELETEVNLELSGLQDTVNEINGNTQPPPTTTTPAPTPAPLVTRGPQQACLDSTFRGSLPSLNVCGAAVRFNKCHLQFVAFHCCRSCFDGGKIPEDGDWRYLNLSRDVSILQAFNYMRPAVSKGSGK